MRQKPDGKHGPWGRACQAEGTVHAKSLRRSGAATRSCSHVDHSQGFAFYAEQAGKSADGLVQKSDMILVLIEFLAVL